MPRWSAGRSGGPGLAIRILVAGAVVLVGAAVANRESVQARRIPQAQGRLAATVPGPEDADSPEETTGSLAATPTFAPAPVVHQPPFDRAAYLGTPVAFVPNSKREIALTFDDGPSKHTATIVRVLAANGARATFFMVGKRAEFNQRAVLSVIEAGDELGDHTWSHRSLRHLDAADIAAQIDRSQAILEAESGSAPLFVRPRGGKYDDTGRTALASRGLILALWSIHANDVGKSPAPDVLVRNVVGPARPGSIVLMHETNDNTVEALPRILEGLRAKGLRPVTLSQLLADRTP